MLFCFTQLWKQDTKKFDIMFQSFSFLCVKSEFGCPLKWMICYIQIQIKLRHGRSTPERARVHMYTLC
jgi:hypothetical protein